MNVIKDSTEKMQYFEKILLSEPVYFELKI